MTFTASKHKWSKVYQVALENKDAQANFLHEALGLSEGATPFPWQLRLLERFLSEDIPRSLDLPTGIGKTSTIAIWLVAKILGATLPRRLVLIVNNRAVVDQATDEAERLRAWLSGRGELRNQLGLGERELPVSTLRGQFADNRAWMRDPSVPAIIVGTVDMIGSRLLFQAYRSGTKLRSYMAGLLGHDTLFVLDEAHLVPSFERLLAQVTTSDAPWSTKPYFGFTPAAPKLISLSATNSTTRGSSFQLDTDDLEHAVVRARMHATKRLSLVAVDDGETLIEKMVARALFFNENADQPRRVLIFTSSREDAVKVSESLRAKLGLAKLKKNEIPAADVALLVGARRVRERHLSRAQLAEFGFLAGGKATPERPAFLVATSAGEVGIDLDADDMVCDLAPWERMIQRLGRVNRRGTRESRVEVVLGVKPEPSKPPKVDLLRLWHAYQVPFRHLPISDLGGLDASPAALLALRERSVEDDALRDELVQATSPQPRYPALSLEVLEDWAMTSLKPHPGRPSIAPWLHGWDKDEAQTTAYWREVMPCNSKGELLQDKDVAVFLENTPPQLSELLQARTKDVADWLYKRAKSFDFKRTDVQQGAAPFLVAVLLTSNDAAPAEPLYLEEVLREKAAGLEKRLKNADIMVNAALGGVSEGLLDPKNDTPVVAADGADAWEAGIIPFRVRLLDGVESVGSDGWKEVARIVYDATAEGDARAWLVVERNQDAYLSESSKSSGRPQLLDEHQKWAAQSAAEIATRLSLPSEGASAVVLSALLHDEGKRAHRWQTAFRAPTADDAWAKTRGPVNIHMLDGYRHEFGSVLKVQNLPQVRQMGAEAREMLLHLIASHHGHARPSIRVTGCAEAPPSALMGEAQKVALRYMDLQHRIGPWGLAWWETLLRSADQQASAANDTRPDVIQEETR